MKKLEISPDFTVDDIHKVREYNYEMTKKLSLAERLDYYRREADSLLREYSLACEPVKCVRF